MWSWSLPMLMPAFAMTLNVPGNGRHVDSDRVPFCVLKPVDMIVSPHRR
jgi:hypothetical protein